MRLKPQGPASTEVRPEHSEWGASGAHRWMVCSKSIELSQGAVDSPSFYAEEGTVAHFIGEQCLRNADRNPGDFIGQKLKGQELEIDVTEEMAEAVELYVQTVRTDRLLLGGELMIEHKFDISQLVSHLKLPAWSVNAGKAPLLYGRNDCCLFVESTGHLIVYDYKHGRGHAVDVENNPQLLYYGLGALLERDRARKRRIKSMELVIIQPRASHAAGPVRRWNVDLFALMEWRADLIRSVERTLLPSSELIAGEHCLFCKAYAGCPKQREKAYEMAALDFRAMTKPEPPKAPESLSLDQLSLVLRWLDEYGEDWFKAVRHHAHTLANAGISFPGYKLVDKRPARVFIEQDEQRLVKQLIKDFELTPDEAEALYTEPELKSVAQVEAVLKSSKKLKNKLYKDLWEEYYKKFSSGTVLAPDDDPRPALPPPATADFAHLIPASANMIDI